jgi:putative N6-adenine-specific DNA methylase
MRLTAVTFGGLEQVLARELRQLGASKVRPGRRAVRFEGDVALLYRANLQLRTALRVLRPIATFSIRTQRQLYENVQGVRWDALMGVGDTLAVDSAVSSTVFRHSKYAALVVKDAVVDQFRGAYHARPSVDTADPTLRIHLHVRGNLCAVSLDSSGESLHRRGYRLASTRAPLSEVLAAAIVMLCGWDGRCPLVDPMCGSGTLAIEAALVAMRRAPGLLRKRFGLMRWRDFDRRLWDRAVREAEAAQCRPTCAITGADVSARAVAAARDNAARAGVSSIVRFVQQPFDRFSPGREGGVVLLDPPYGKRLAVGDTREFGAQVGRRLAEAYAGYRAWIISAAPQFFDGVGLRPFARHRLDNGGLACELRGFGLGSSGRGKGR